VDEVGNVIGNGGGHTQVDHADYQKR